MTPFVEPVFWLTLVSGVFVAAASGLVGSFLIMRRMALLSDALSHIALPGIALGVILHFQPILGGLLTLFLGIVLIWLIQHKTRLAVESITGVLFVTSLALGAILIPETELLEAFFGGLEKLSFFQILFQTLVSFVVIIVILGQIKKLTLVSIAPELATASRVSERKIELLLLVLIALTIAIGISFVGVLLISALSIVPAATARNFAKNFKSFLLFSVLLAVAALAIGIALAPLLRIGTGVLTVLASAFFFSLSLLRKK